MSATVTVIISEKTGEVSLKVGGITGKKCLDLTQQIEEAIGVTTNRTETTDMYAHKPAQVNQHKNRR